MQAADFQVEEQLGFELAGEGEHACVWVEKTGANTQYVARQLAKLSGIALRDVGFCGMKDRHAVTRQWFSLGLAGKPEPDWSSFESHEFRVLESRRHLRKLRRGVHSGNRFALILRELDPSNEEALQSLQQRLQKIAAQGVPNYFGEQRFGGDNLERALAWSQGTARRPRRDKAGLYLSVLRAWLFNQLLAQRVGTGDWAQLQEGDLCLLQGSRSRFCATEIDADLTARNQSGDISPALPLWGRGEWECSELRAQEFEAQRAEFAQLCQFLADEGLRLEWRATRLWPDDFSWQFCDDGGLKVEFRLAPGGYATAVLRELLDYKDITRGMTVSE